MTDTLLPYLAALFIIYVILLRLLVPRRWRWAAVLAASIIYVFANDYQYAAWLLAGLSLFWALSRWMEGQRGPARKRLLVVSVILAIGALCYYKYSYLLGGSGAEKLAVPLGMSYFSFRLVHYLVERYRELTPALSLPRFIHYLIFFPTFNAGPIERAERFVEVEDESALDLAEGTRRIVFGLFKSVVVAALLARWCLPVLGSPAGHDPATLLLAVYALAFYIYYDFAGYSDMAIGAGRLLGYKIMENFDRPYLSSSPAEFWRRWHISLSFWLRDYVYIPMGGSRAGRLRHYLNYMVVMAVCGMWHGSEAHFVAWGVYHGVGLVVYHLWRSLMGDGDGSPWRKALGVAVTFNFVAIGWVVFFHDVDHCLVIGARMLGLFGGAL